jgi:hypothetical protein
MKIHRHPVPALVAAALALAGSASRIQAQTIITNTFTFTFATGGATSDFKSTWIYWYGSPGSNSPITEDVTKDASNNTSSGSLMVVSPLAGGSQDVFFGTFASNINNGYDFSVEADLLLYSNISFDILVAPDTPLSPNGDFGSIGVGIINASYVYQEFGRPTIPAIASSQWVHLSVPIDKARNNLTNVPGIAFDINSYGGYPLFTITNWIDNIAAIALPASPQPSSVTIAPASQSVIIGSNATFTVWANGSLPLSYQWQFDQTNLMNGGNIFVSSAGALTVSNVSTANAGSYSVVVSNAYGAATSAVAILNVLQPFPGLNILMTNTDNQYAREMISAGDTGYSFVGQSNATYSWTIGMLPPAGHTSFQQHFFLIGDDNGSRGTDGIADWDAPNVIFITVQENIDGSATMDFRWKTNEPEGNTLIWQATSGSLTVPSGLGTWSVSFQAATNVTLTGPNGATTNFVFSEAAAQMFADPLVMFLGGQANAPADEKCDIVIQNFSVSGVKKPFVDDFTSNNGLSPPWVNASADPAAILVVPAAVQGQDYTWITNADDVSVTITEYTGTGGAVAIPTTIDGLLVTSIGEAAFPGCTNVTSVTIPGSITSIGDYAFFGCTSLTSVTIPASVTYIGYYGFSGCTSLTNVVIPGSVTNIGDGAFQVCTSLTSVSIPGTVTSIGEYAFLQCTSLTNVTISNGVTSIGDFAFVNCANLTSVTIPGSVTNIGDWAFEACTNLTSVTIPGSVTSIGVEAFSTCTSLTSVTIPGSVTSIGNYAFYDCTSLSSITIPGSVTSIGGGAFSYCTMLRAIAVDTQNSFYSSTDGVLFDKSQTTLIQFPSGLSGSYTIPASVTRIGDYAFADSTSLTSVTIPASLTTIGDYAFSDCTSLTNATIPASVTSIGDFAFSDCTSLTSATIPANVTSIGEWAFEDCTNLTSVTIPASVTSIGVEAFAYCTRLRAIAVDTQNSFYSSTNGVLFDKSQTTLIQFPSGLSGSYTIPAGVTSIGDSAFADSTSLTSVTIADGVTNIGELAFSDCTSLTSVTILASVTSIGDYAFEGCTSLTSVYFGGNAPTVGSDVFIGDNNATIFYLAGTTGWGYTFAGLPHVQSNPQSEFTYTTNAAAITITGYFGPGGTVIIPAIINGLPVTSIGAEAFIFLTNLTSVTIPAGITNIGDYAFLVCTSLASVIFEGNAPTVGSYVFGLDNNATVFYLPGTTGWNSTFAGLPAVLFQFTPANMVPFTQPANNATLVVTLVPAEANGQWRFPWELTWRDSGTAATNLVPNQNYTVQFSPVPGYLAIPALVTNFVAGGETSFVTGQYYPTITSVDATNGGSLKVLFQVNPPSGAGWRLLGDTNAFLPSGFTTNLLPGDYLIQCAALSNFVQIPILSVRISAGLPTVVQEIYQPSQPAPTGILLPVPVPSGEISDTNYPYGFNGQLETDVGYGSGVAVQANVVLTAAHLVFNDQTLSYVSQAWWYPQEEAPQFMPEPQAAQGWLVLSGYASQRTNDLQSGLYTADQSSPQSRNFDVAALYFQSSVAGGGYGGYLSSDATSNSWLTSTAEKMLVGYPVDGSMFQASSVVAGQMYEIGPQPYPLSLATDPVNDQQVYTTSWFLSYPGNSGGPFYVQFDGYYYPAGVYLGTLFNGTVPYASAVRGIDSNVVNLITNAQAIVTTGTNNSGGGVVTINAGSGIAGNPGAVEVTISPPAVVQAGGAWKLSTLSDSWYSTQNPSALAVNSTNEEQLQFKPITGWNLPANQSVTVAPGTVTCLTNSYTLAVSWPTPAAITYGTALSSKQLNATNVIGVRGNYAYNPTNGSMLNVGTNTLSVIFTPSDTTEYGGASATSVSLVVLPPAPDIQTVRRSGSSFTFTWSATANQQYQIQTKTNLTQPNWTTLGSVLTATNSSMTTAASIGANSQQFYRVVLLP